MAYSDIDSGKVLNKEGLLELSNQIKSYIDANSGGSGSNPLIHSMLQMTTAGNSSGYPNVIKLNNNSSWEEFVEYIKAGKIVYIYGATSYTFSATYQLTAELLGVPKLYAMTPGDFSIPMMNSSVASYGDAGTQVYYSTYYYFDGAFLWSWKKPEDLGNFIKVRYRNSMNTALGYALQQITTDIDKKFTTPTAPTTDGTYMLKCVVSSGTPTYSWESVNVGGSY